MQTIHVTLKNKKAIAMLNSMRELALIDFENVPVSKDSWAVLFTKIKAKSKGAKMSMSEISKEVEAVRRQLYKDGNR